MKEKSFWMVGVNYPKIDWQEMSVSREGELILYINSVIMWNKLQKS